MHLFTADLKYFLWLHAEWGRILLVHWYDCPLKKPMKSENQTVVRFKQPIKIEKP